MPGKQPFATIDDYIATFPENVQITLEQIRQTIRTAAPEASETITYGIPTFDLDGRHLVFFAGWKRHISLYPIPAGDAAYQERIAGLRNDKGTIQLPLNKPIPYDLVSETARFLRSERS